MSCTELYIPGYGNSGAQHWQTLWCESRPGALRIEFPAWEAPVEGAWQGALAALLNSLDQPVIAVAHSLGCLALVQHIAAQGRGPLAGLFLVAPPDWRRVDFPEAIQGYREVYRGSLGLPGHLLYSTDDPYSNEAFSLQCAQTWGLEAHNFGPRGHLNAQSNLGSWPEAAALLDHLNKGVTS